ncbi:hypothetical protein [Paenibacillus sp. Leaf72]|uniref:hypothetical protein n=1 Tax=Paenibacillus sp. Leaf72 TaxID=1736234 RepID=UPI0012DD4CE8|nr:hypothetical protein [Paenibacillus sp. Leaf72]
MKQQREDTIYCGYLNAAKSCSLLTEMAKADTCCKLWRGEDSIACRYLSTIAKRRR